MEFSPDQQRAISAIRNWLKRGDTQTLTFGGLAGTGKTTIIANLGELLGREIIYCAPTGKASRVLASKLPEGELTYTIHQLIYHPMENHCQTCPAFDEKDGECHADGKSRCGCGVSWRDKESPGANKLYVVDESSMLDKELYQDLLVYVNGNPVLFVGDHGQLPPVRSSFNLMANPTVRLETIHRQVADSPILKLAMMARTTGHIPYGDYGPGVRKVHANQLEVDMDDETLMLCYTNKTRTDYNQWIRNSLGKRGRPKAGERLICLRNNWRSGVYNGLTGTLVSIDRTVSGLYDVTIALDDEKLYQGIISARQFNAPSTFVADKGDQFDFGYCLTVHKAQGSQSKRIILLEERSYMTEKDWRRWLYTGVTRAVSELLIVGED